MGNKKESDLVNKMGKKLLLYLKMIKPHRISRALCIFRKEGLSGIKYHFYLVKDKEKGKEKDCRREYDISPVTGESRNCMADGGNYPVLAFQEPEEPDVSILIPVYNQFEYTYRCLEHIKKYSENVSYEIIIGDDCSSDMSAELERFVKGVKIIHHPVNYQFLRNCNRISQEAKGEYLVFINNDTQVQAGWLDTLVDLMEADEKIGLAGSKMIYPDGMVQEAGGIVWKDATVLQFGNGRQPGEEELNRQRETDYISGASIMIRKALWEEIGGFDERFVPAYYEDVDLAFQVRERGYKVVYQPKSEVVHFEGATEGMDEEKGRRVEVNRKRFYEKWEKRLLGEHYAPEEYGEMVRGMRG